MAIKESPYGSIEPAQLSRWSGGSVGPFIFADLPEYLDHYRGSCTVVVSSVNSCCNFLLVVVQ